MAITRGCARCGKSFRVKPSLQSRRFCSKTCFYDMKRDGSAPPPVDGACWIPLGHERFALVDADIATEISQWRWCVSGKVAKGRKLYAHRPFKISEDAAWKGNTAWVKLHIFIARPPPGMEVDHINGDTMDNRRQNLRWATNQQNCINRRTDRHGLRGVYPADGSWSARIKTHSKQINVGRYATPADAAHAYDEAARRVHGEFARFNYPAHGEQPID